MKKRILALAAMGILASITGTEAKTAVWSEIGNWTIFGDSESRSCRAYTEFNSGMGMAIDFRRGNASLAIVNINATPMARITARVSASNGAYGVFEGIVNDLGTIVVFPNLSVESLRTLRAANTFYIQSLGGFSLQDSSLAMKEAWRCYEALNSY